MLTTDKEIVKRKGRNMERWRYGEMEKGNMRRSRDEGMGRFVNGEVEECDGNGVFHGKMREIAKYGERLMKPHEEMGSEDTENESSGKCSSDNKSCYSAVYCRAVKLKRRRGIIDMDDIVYV